MLRCPGSSMRSWPFRRLSCLQPHHWSRTAVHRCWNGGPGTLAWAFKSHSLIMFNSCSLHFHWSFYVLSSYNHVEILHEEDTLRALYCSTHWVFSQRYHLVPVLWGANLFGLVLCREFYGKGFEPSLEIGSCNPVRASSRHRPISDGAPCLGSTSSILRHWSY